LGNHQKQRTQTATLNAHQQAIEAQIKTLLERYLEPRWAQDPRNRIAVSGSTNLTSDLTLDSFQVMEFMMQIEDELDVVIDINSLSDVHTVSELAAIVAQQAAA